MNILCGDIGGTKTLLRLSRIAGTQCEPLRQQKFNSADYSTFEQILEEFIQPGDLVQNFCVGIAGPVSGAHARVTNLPWEISADILTSRFQFKQVRLINDFQAVGYGINSLPESGFLVLQQGSAVKGANQAVIGAGTGLGEAILVWHDQAYEVLASEGGHVDFAPTDDTQIRLLQHLRKSFGAVSYELIRSGPGLQRIYSFLQQEQQRDVELEAAAITQAAIDGDAMALQALNLFMAVYGAQAGNLALTAMAQEGLYIAGGIAVRIAHLIQSGPFMQHFRNKSKMSDLLANIPVKLVLDAEVGLNGAQEVARRL